MKIFRLLAFALFFPFTTWASDQACSALANDITTKAYEDTEFRTYTCPPSGVCSVSDFLALIELRSASLAYGDDKRDIQSCFVTTKIKGKQFPTLVFTGAGSPTTLVLSDYESGLTIAKNGSKGMHDLIGLTHKEPGRLEKNFYSWNGRAYFLRKTSCFKVVARKGGTATDLISQRCKP